MATAEHLSTSATRLIANQCLFNALAVIGATATAFTTTGTGDVTIDGRMFALTAQTNTALAALAASNLPTSQADWVQPSGSLGFYVQPANTTVYYLIGVIAAGTWLVIQGTHDGQILAQGYARGRSVIPDVPLGFTPVSVLKVVTAGSAFTPATTALTGLGTFINIGVLPIAGTF